MSLRVWLPLNGDLKNKGLDDIAVTNNGATIDNSGKIGKCYYFNGSAQYLQLSKTLGDIYSGNFSWAVWLKPEDDTRGVIISEYSSTGSSNVAFELLANRVIRVYWNGSPDISTGVSIEKDKWSHVTITKKDDTIKVYVNGELKTTRTQTLSDRSSTSKIRIGDDYRGGTSVSYMGYMNDIRIYDHALSLKQVQQISKGLILHYKLDNDSMGNFNILLNTHFDTRSSQTTGWDTSKNGTLLANSWGGYNAGVSNASTVYHAHLKNFNGEYVYEYIKTANESWLGIWQNDLQTKLVANKTYTFSWEEYHVEGTNRVGTGLDYYKTGASSANFHLGIQQASNITRVLNKWQKFSYTFTAPTDADWSKSMTWYIYGHYNNNGTFYFRHPKLEEGSKATPWCPAKSELIDSNIIYDSSGYQNDGTIINNIEIDTNSSKYVASTVFNGTNYIKLIPPTSEIRTLSLWINWETIPSGQSVIFLDYASKLGLGLMSTGILCGTSGPGNYKTFSKTNLTANTWYHFVVINPDEEIGLNRKLYINGVEQSPTSSVSNWSYNVNQMQIGKRSSTSDGFIGKLSDLRLYSTVLSEADIKELYQTSALIDRNQNLYVRELVEI